MTSAEGRGVCRIANRQSAAEFALWKDCLRGDVIDRLEIISTSARTKKVENHCYILSLLVVIQYPPRAFRDHPLSRRGRPRICDAAERVPVSDWLFRGFVVSDRSIRRRFPPGRRRIRLARRRLTFAHSSRGLDLERLPRASRRPRQRRSRLRRGEPLGGSQPFFHRVPGRGFFYTFGTVRKLRDCHSRVAEWLIASVISSTCPPVTRTLPGQKRGGDGQGEKRSPRYARR